MTGCLRCHPGFPLGGSEGGCWLAWFVHAVHEVASSLYHALVDELLERLFFARHSEVVQKLVPEARVDEMARGVLRSAYVQVDVAPVLVGLGAYEAWSLRLSMYLK